MISVGQNTDRPSVVCLINLLLRPKVAPWHIVCVCNCVCGDVHVDVWCVCVPDCAYLSAYVTCFSICSCVLGFFFAFFLFIISTGPWVHTLDCTCCCWVLKPAPGTERHVWLTSSLLCKSLGGEQWSQAFQMDLGAGWLMHHSWPGFSRSLPSLASSHQRPDQVHRDLCHSSCLENVQPSHQSKMLAVYISTNRGNVQISTSRHASLISHLQYKCIVWAGFHIRRRRGWWRSEMAFSGMFLQRGLDIFQTVLW